MLVPVGVKRRPPTPVLTRAPAWKGALLERTCSLQQRALVRSERVRSHLGKNLGSSAAILGAAGEARMPRRRAKKTTAYPLKTERMLGERIYLRGAICIFGTRLPSVFASNPGTVQANQGSTRSAKTVYVYTSSPYNHAHHP